MKNRNIIPICAALALAALAVAPAAEAGKTCLVSKFRYENRGSYRVSYFEVHKKGRHDGRPGTVTQYRTETFVLSNSDYLDRGDEVWLTYEILDFVTGNKKISCRKDGTTLQYDPVNGNTWNFWSKGTTQEDHRCQFSKNTCVPLQSE